MCTQRAEEEKFENFLFLIYRFLIFLFNGATQQDAFFFKFRKSTNLKIVHQIDEYVCGYVEYVTKLHKITKKMI